MFPTTYILIEDLRGAVSFLNPQNVTFDTWNLKSTVFYDVKVTSFLHYYLRCFYVFPTICILIEDLHGPVSFLDPILCLLESDVAIRSAKQAIFEQVSENTLQNP